MRAFFVNFRLFTLPFRARLLLKSGLPDGNIKARPAGRVSAITAIFGKGLTKAALLRYNKIGTRVASIRKKHFLTYLFEYEKTYCCNFIRF